MTTIGVFGTGCYLIWNLCVMKVAFKDKHKTFLFWQGRYAVFVWVCLSLYTCSFAFSFTWLYLLLVWSAFQCDTNAQAGVVWSFLVKNVLWMKLQNTIFTLLWSRYFQKNKTYLTAVSVQQNEDAWTKYEASVLGRLTAQPFLPNYDNLKRECQLIPKFKCSKVHWSISIRAFFSVKYLFQLCNFMTLHSC